MARAQTAKIERTALVVSLSLMLVASLIVVAGQAWELHKVTVPTFMWSCPLARDVPPLLMRVPG
jgi:hypothetical protein